MIRRAVLSAFILPLLAAAQTSVGRYEVLELDFPHPSAGLANVWEDVALDVVFTAPSQRSVSVGGFYHSPALWKARFAPDEIGAWSWSATLRDPNGTQQFSGTFDCVPSSEKGFVRSHPGNPFRWVYDADGSLFVGLGFGDCMSSDTTRSIFGPWGFDGGIRPPVPHGERPGWSEPFETYLTAYGDVAGMNLVRLSDGNCAFSIKGRIDPAGNTYNAAFSRRVDTICAALRAHGFRIYYDIGGWTPPYITEAADTAKMAAVKRYAKYCVDRWGAYVDFWELMNETSGVDPDWYTIVVNDIRSIDPYRHAVSTSFEQPAHPAIDIVSPHWYQSEPATDSDLETASRIANFRPFGKPIIFGEQGNSGRNWDSTSALRMRGRIWSAFFNEAILLFWNSSYARDNGGGAANLYLGAEERQYIRALQTFAANVDSSARMVHVPVQGPGIRAYGLRSPRMFAAYVRSGTSVTATRANVSVTIDAPVTGVASWYDVRRGRTIATETVTAGTHNLTAPDFVCDVALYVGDPLPAAEDYFPLAVEPRDMPFDSVAVGDTRTRRVTLRNVGEKTVTVSSVGLSGRDAAMFATGSIAPPFSIAPGDSAEVFVYYRPMVEGGHTAHLVVAHDGAPVPEFIALSGVATMPTAVYDARSAAPVPAIVRIAPHPAHGRTEIVCALPATGTARLAIFDSYGRLVLSRNIESTGANARSVYLDVSALTPGVYGVMLVGGGSGGTGLMVVE